MLWQIDTIPSGRATHFLQMSFAISNAIKENVSKDCSSRSKEIKRTKLYWEIASYISNDIFMSVAVHIFLAPKQGEIIYTKNKFWDSVFVLLFIITKKLLEIVRIRIVVFILKSHTYVILLPKMHWYHNNQ